MVAMVGARNASAAACRFARGLASDLADADLVVVSGLARGIDAAAHWGALGGGTIGVVAGGLDVAYPPENTELQARIAATRASHRRNADRDAARRRATFRAATASSPGLRPARS